ncbi:MAG: alpha/beta hydrolase-fold protein [Pseudomonadota bacterium]
MPLDINTHLALGLDQPTPAAANGRSNRDAIAGLNHPDDDIYQPCAEALNEGTVPTGKYVKYSAWRESRLYPGTERGIALYLPPQHDAAEPLNLLICNDGAGYASLRGPVRVTRVLDSLLHAGEIAPTAAVFINPGLPDPTQLPPTPNLSYDDAANQRSWEYDSLTPVYAEFLQTEVLPWLAAAAGVTFTGDPAQRTVCGISSGGIAAFNCAWFHPEWFGRVISHCGSFTNIRGGHNYPYLVQSTERKPIRIFLQSGSNDITTLFGHWPTANMAMAHALEYAGYDYRFEFGQGGHTLKHGGALFADTLRWLWRSQT